MSPGRQLIAITLAAGLTGNRERAGFLLESTPVTTLRDSLHREIWTALHELWVRGHRISLVGTGRMMRALRGQPHRRIAWLEWYLIQLVDEYAATLARRRETTRRAVMMVALAEALANKAAEELGGLLVERLEDEGPVSERGQAAA